jgi:peptidoglycan/xylan/chitin deacetylase (PgdA/CDA1 family)
MIPAVSPKILKCLFRQLIWDINTPDKKVFLTFDDGPEPEVTPQVLALLLKYNAQATFFCLGEKAEKYPSLITQIKECGHVIGSHGYRHLSGFTTKNKIYTDNFRKGISVLNTHLYRPPYGRITPKQIKNISAQSKIVLWSIMSMDFHAKITSEQCAHNVLHNIFPGAIVVFHDSLKASHTLLKTLPVILGSLQEKGYKLEGLY